MKKLLLIICYVLLCLSGYTQSAKAIREARQVIDRFTEGQASQVQLKWISQEEGKDVFTTTVKNGKLVVGGSSGVALCRGFYDFVKSQNGGICSWSGKRYALDIPNESEMKRVVSPVKHHYYLNVVTYGYSMPYWDWKRWEEEIDWMALHGIDMPLALVANEAISARVWKKLGLTEKEIAAYFVGPAHLPWMRMGNISGIDGPLPAEWHTGQIKLQHRILDRMKKLGMKPICPGFAGFVPQAFQRLYPDLKLVETAWCGGAFHNWMLSPEDPLFAKIGKMFIEEWEKEFGKNDYYIIDSFNEMEVPFPPHGTPERYRLLSAYGDQVYRSLQAGNPDAIWVMQGWMFGYQRDIWDPETLKALLSKVPDDKMLLLDLAVDYNQCFWKNICNWELYKGFLKKPWVYSVIPNMGGKNGLTGILSFYANGHLQALNSPNRGKLEGIGMAPEGIENNEVIYELMSDAGWREDSISIDQWLENYWTCRYGKTPEKSAIFWGEMQRSVYGSFTDHPRYNWQFRPGRVQKGSININADFYKAIETFAGMAEEMQGSILYKNDLIEYTAAYLGGKLEVLAVSIQQCYALGDTLRAGQLEKQFETFMLGMDRLLESHPVYRLSRWLEFARQWGTDSQLKDYYEKNARRIVTIWGPPVDDYSARIWSGLIRDYYWPRWKMYFEGLKSGRSQDIKNWERQWVEKHTGLTDLKPYEDVIAAALELIQIAKAVKYEGFNERSGEVIGTWTPAEVSEEWQEMIMNLPVSKLSDMKGVLFKYIRGANQLMIREVILEMDGVEVCHIKQEGSTGLQDHQNFYRLVIPKGVTGNNSCVLKAIVRSDGRADSYGQVTMVL